MFTLYATHFHYLKHVTLRYLFIVIDIKHFEYEALLRLLVLISEAFYGITEKVKIQIQTEVVEKW